MYKVLGEAENKVEEKPTELCLSGYLYKDLKTPDWLSSKAVPEDFKRNNTERKRVNHQREN